MYQLNFILIVLDYVLTYIGLSKNLIYEANPLMVSFMGLPLILGATVRIGLAGILILSLYLTRNRSLYSKYYDGIKLIRKHRFTGKPAIFVIFGIQLVVYLFHALWIIAAIKGGI